MNPQLGARKHSQQAKATDLISSNQADSAPGATAGGGGAATAGLGGFLDGPGGMSTPAPRERPAIPSARGSEERRLHRRRIGHHR